MLSKNWYGLYHSQFINIKKLVRVEALYMGTEYWVTADFDFGKSKDNIWLIQSGCCWFGWFSSWLHSNTTKMLLFYTIFPKGKKIQMETKDNHSCCNCIGLAFRVVFPLKTIYTWKLSN
jgi:hypothetical protein